MDLVWEPVWGLVPVKQKLPPSAGGLSLWTVLNVPSAAGGAVLSVKGQREGEHGHVLNTVPNWITRWK